MRTEVKKIKIFDFFCLDMLSPISRKVEMQISVINYGRAQTRNEC